MSSDGERVNIGWGSAVLLFSSFGYLIPNKCSRSPYLSINFIFKLSMLSAPFVPVSSNEVINSAEINAELSVVQFCPSIKTEYVEAERKHYGLRLSRGCGQL